MAGKISRQFFRILRRFEEKLYLRLVYIIIFCDFCAKGFFITTLVAKKL